MAVRYITVLSGHDFNINYIQPMIHSRVGLWSIMKPKYTAQNKKRKK